jgi:predicted aminopeptidase
MARESVEELIEDPETDASLSEKLQLVREARAYSSRLGLDVGDQYTSYVPWPGDRVVTTVVATRPGEVDPFSFWFPVIGDAPYKGFFRLDLAQEEADRLAAQGMDTCLLAIPAYSTLGWLADPLTAPMLNTSRDRLVETVIHELVHASVFVKSQPDFNEGAASFVGEEATIRFYDERAATTNGKDVVDQRARVTDDRLVAATLLGVRRSIASLYEEDLSAAERERRRAAIQAEARIELAALPLSTRDPARLAEHARLNDACLALVGTYSADTPRHEAVLHALDGDFSRYMDRLREAARSDDPRATFFDL